MENKQTETIDDSSNLDWTASKAISDLESICVRQLCSSYQDRVFDLSNKIAKERMKKGQQISWTVDSKKAIWELLQMKQEEVMSVLFLDIKNRLIVYEELFHGSINSATIHIRVLVKKALEYNSASIILAHNHPSGDCEPSSADREITQRIQQAMQLIEVRLLDHFVVGVEWLYSFAENGEM